MTKRNHTKGSRASKEGKATTMCAECEENEATIYDPRYPPLEEDECLCAACFIDAAQEEIDKLNEQIVSLKSEISAARKALQEASRALTEIDPGADHHDPVIIDDALSEPFVRRKHA